MGCRALMSASIPVNALKLSGVLFDSIGIHDRCFVVCSRQASRQVFFSINPSVTRAIMAVFVGSYEQHSF